MENYEDDFEDEEFLDECIAIMLKAFKDASTISASLQDL